jgi:hypothetical protein
MGQKMELIEKILKDIIFMLNGIKEICLKQMKSSEL